MKPNHFSHRLIIPKPFTQVVECYASNLGDHIAQESQLISLSTRLADEPVQSTPALHRGEQPSSVQRLVASGPRNDSCTVVLAT